MSYQEHKIDLSKPQAKKLLNGDKIRLTHSKILGSKGIPIYLTKIQLNKIKKSIKDKKGMDLQFSNIQLKHNVKHGSGLFDDIKSGLKNVAGDLARQGVKYGLEKGTEYLTGKLDDKLKSYGAGMNEEKGSGLFGLPSIFGDGVKKPRKIKMKKNGDGLLDFITETFSGNGVKKHRKKKKEGEGLFSVISDTFNQGRDAVNAGVAMGVAKRIGGNLKKGGRLLNQKQLQVVDTNLAKPDENAVSQGGSIYASNTGNGIGMRKTRGGSFRSVNE